MIDWNNAIDSYLKSKERRKDTYEPDLFSASSVSGCIRQCVRTRLGLGTLSPQTLRHFHIGHEIHRLIQTEVALGHIGEPVEFEKQISFTMDGIRFKGHIDCVSASEVIDFKSTSSIPVTTSYPTSKAYLYQLAIYKEGLERLTPGTHPIRETVIVYIDKRNLNTHRKIVTTPPMSEILFFCRQVIEAEKIYAKSRILPPKCAEACFSCKNEVPTC